MELRTLFATWLLMPLFASATSNYESEPNNTPAEANAVSGAATILGTMSGSDQDAFMWTVSDEDAQKQWVFELHGIPGRLTIAEVVRVEFAADGASVEKQDRLMKMGTRDGYTPAITRELIFEPGEYLIGIAYAGGSADQQSSGGPFRPPAAGLSFGDSGKPDLTEVTDTPDAPEPGTYRFVIREVSKISLQPTPKGTTQAEARKTRAGGYFHTFETRDTAWYSLDFKPEDTNQRWDINVHVPVGRAMDATLFDSAGQQLDKRRSGPRGHLEFPDIVPQEQPYALQLEPLEVGLVTVVGSLRTGVRVAGEEAEPNGKWELANQVDLTQPLKAAINDATDADFFKFLVDGARADTLHVLRLDSEPIEQQVLFCLHDAQGTQLQCRDATTPIALPDLLLSPGEYGLTIARARSEFQYTVSLTDQGPVARGREVEPNDTITIATTVPANNRIKGRGTGTDTDYYRFLIAEEPQLWRFQTIGEGIKEVTLHDGAGHASATHRPQAGQRRIRLENVFLLPGKHYVRISAEDGAEYTLLAKALGPPDPNGEREPNDDKSRMQRLAVGQTRTGLLVDKVDVDYYRFFLANWDHVKLAITPPPDAIVAPHLYWYDSSMAQGIPSEPGQVMTYAGVFPPGDYYVQLKANQPSDAEYRLSLERLPRWSCLTDCEPNGMYTYFGASRLPPNLMLEGVSGAWRDADSYQLPALDQPSQLIVRSPERVGGVFLGPNHLNRQPMTYDTETGTYTGTVVAGEPMQVSVDSGGKLYRLELEFENGPKPLADVALPVELTLALETDAVSAFRQFGQVVSGRLTITNVGTSGLTARLETATSDYRWRAALGADEYSADAGESVTVPIEVRVPPDAWADRPVRISVRAVDELGAQAETWSEIAVDRETLPVNPAWNWAIPDALRGGFNAAWIPFGGGLTGEVPQGADNPFLRDGYVIDTLSTQCCHETYGWKDTRPAITLKLPGEALLPVAGMALHHFGIPWPYHKLRKGTLLLSEDGATFKEAMSFETLPVRTEQYFALTEPVLARYVQLRLEETYEHQSGNGGVTMGEWKVILAPGYDLSNGAGFDIASPEFGGHLVWDWPPEYYSPVAILDEGKRSYEPRIGPDAELEYVIAFQDNRAAQIQRIEWTNPEGANPEHAFENIVVSVTTESPIGPWKTVGELDPGYSAETEALVLETSQWARFVKFTGVRQGQSSIVLSPNVIRIWERPTSENYRSVLAEWGQLSKKGWFEEQQGIPPEPGLTASNNTSRGKAAPLHPNQLVNGQVQLAKRSHWYRLAMPAGDNTLTISLAGQPTVRTVLALENGAGEPIPAEKIPLKSTPREHVFEAFAEPGSEVFLHVFEPPRNVIFTWDTSASVNAYLPDIYNALAAFVGQVVPGQESANFVPFSESPLLDTWLGEPYMLQTILNDYPRKQSSSAGEFALTVSTQALAPVAGTKSIMIITDGAVNHHGPLWKDLREIQPRVFSVGVAGEGGHNLDVFADWSSVNGGHFTHLRYQGEMEVAFDRAATLMRRPADYTLAVQTEYREAPGPGLLQVVSAAEGAGASVRGAVALILDASGSMLQRMNGKRRIAIAKEVLTEAVREQVPAGTPVVVRVFGHKEPGTCATEVLVPLAPLAPDAAAAAIANVQAKNLAKTPIADSLAAVRADLKGAQPAVVILVTDGEETCEGDPAAVIASLRDQGIDITLNIVGFAIDDAALEAQFTEWAETGGGRYFSAQDQSGLSEAIEKALQIPYSVFDASGTVVAKGLVDGEPVALERGVYRVAVKGTDTFDSVEVQGEDEILLELK